MIVWPVGIEAHALSLKLQFEVEVPVNQILVASQ
jgi:hypothetical protein